MFNAIVSLEQTLDSLLPRPRLWGRAPAALNQAAAEWATAVWQAACAAGPVALSATTISAGLEFSKRPVFVCGVHRSGTTLVRDLLDGHPQLAVLPSEGTFFTNHERHLDLRGAVEGLAFMGREWLRRLANPINQPPFWTLGRTTAAHSPYVEFARALLAWWRACQREFPRPASWPLAAIALAFASRDHQGAVPRDVLRWVEKTPTNEQLLGRLWRDFPDARIIHVVRDPAQVLASRKRMEERSFGAFTNIRRVLDDLRASYVAAAEQLERRQADRYLLVRFEDIVGSPPHVVDRLAQFLDIRALPSLACATVGGAPATPNSSFDGPEQWARGGAPGSGEDRADVLSREERLRLAVIVGDAAASVGYAVPA